TKSSAPSASAAERMAQNDGFFAVGSSRNHIDRCLDGFLDKTDVGAGVLWQVFQAPGAEGGFLPAGEFHIHGFQILIAVDVHQTGRRVSRHTFITHAHLDCFQAIKDVQLGETDARYTIDAYRQFDRYGVKPATAAVATGRRP